MEMLETSGTPKITLVDFNLASTLDSDWTSKYENNQRVVTKRRGSTEEGKISARIIHNKDTTQHALQSETLRALIRKKKWFRMPSAEREHWGCNMGWAYLHQIEWAFGVVVWIALRDIEPYEAFAHDYGFDGILDDAKPLAQSTRSRREQDYEDSESSGGGSLYRLIEDAKKQQEVHQARQEIEEAAHQAMLDTKQNLIHRCDPIGDHSEEYKRNELTKYTGKQAAQLKKFTQKQQKEKNSFKEGLDKRNEVHRSYQQRITDFDDHSRLTGNTMAQPQQLQLHSNQ